VENGTNGKKTTFLCLLQMENGNGKLPFVAENRNGKWMFVFLSRQAINSNRRLLF
jgi:hypothetical protein